MAPPYAFHPMPRGGARLDPRGFRLSSPLIRQADLSCHGRRPASFSPSLCPEELFQQPGHVPAEDFHGPDTFGIVFDVAHLPADADVLVA